MELKEDYFTFCPGFINNKRNYRRNAECYYNKESSSLLILVLEWLPNDRYLRPKSFKDEPAVDDLENSNERRNGDIFKIYLSF